MAQGRKDVPPNARWSEAIRRAGIIREYLRLQSPSVADADAAATKLGVKRRDFYYLVRAFQNRRRSDPPRRTPEAIEEIIDFAIRSMGYGASLSAVTQTVRELATAKGLSAPARKTVKLRVAHQAMMSLAGSGVIIDHAPLIAAASTGSDRFPPYATVAIAAGRGIVGLSITRSQTIETVANVVGEALGVIGSAAAIEFVAPPDAEKLAERLGRTVIISERFAKAGSAISMLLMGKIGGIPVGQRLSIDKLLAKTAHLPAAKISDIELHLRHELGMSTLLLGVRELLQAEKDGLI